MVVLVVAVVVEHVLTEHPPPKYCTLINLNQGLSLSIHWKTIYLNVKMLFSLQTKHTDYLNQRHKTLWILSQHVKSKDAGSSPTFLSALF